MSDPLAARLRAAGCVWADDEAAALRESFGDDTDALDAATARREAGEPLELVLGRAWLAGVSVATAPGVFVPRRRSEVLVREAVDRLRRGGTVVDLCCGTGAVGLAIAHARGAVLHAADIDPAAVGCARANLAAVPGAAVHEGDLDDALPRALAGRVDILAAVTPYVPTGALRALPAEARDWEPSAALDGGADGLDVARRLVRAAPRWLAPEGLVLTEVSRAQAPRLATAAREAGLVAQIVDDEEHDVAVVVAGRPAASLPVQGRRAGR